MNQSFHHMANGTILACNPQSMADRMMAKRYELSQRSRKKTEEGFAWCKTIGGLARTRMVDRWKITQQFKLTAAAYNLVRMRKLLVA